MKKFLVPAFLLLFCASTQAANLYVSSLNDSGNGTLRAAIKSANINPASTIVFTIAGTIHLNSPLPYVNKPTVIDASTAPGYSSAPVVSIDFAGNPGLTIGTGANGSIIAGLSLVGSVNAALTIQASQVTVQDNYIGLNPDGSVAANSGDGIKILPPSTGNLIGSEDAVKKITYVNTSNASKFTIQPVTAWQGLRNFGSDATQFLIVGTSQSNGLLYTGPINGGGTSYLVKYPGPKIESTSVYGPDNLPSGMVRLVGTYRKTGETSVYNHGFYADGDPSQISTGTGFNTIDYPGATIQYVHSTMSDLAVGNADGPALGAGRPIEGGEISYIYSIHTHAFVTNIVYPNSKTTTAYGIWANSPTTFTICGGYSPVVTSNLSNESHPLARGKGFLVDYDSTTQTFSNWTSFDYPNGAKGASFVTHFEGISGSEPGVYTLSADSALAGSSSTAVQGSWVRVLRNADNTFSVGLWVDLNYPNAAVSSANSVYDNQIVGVTSTPAPYQATVNLAFQLSNVISGNGGNGINLSSSSGNAIAMNYIGTNPAGGANTSYGNLQNGILITNGSSGNIIGGQVTSGNNPTGDKGFHPAVIIRPPQGNLISGNHGAGVLISSASESNVLSGNFIGTTASGTNTLGNHLDGVDIESSNNNSFIGCTFYQNPFVYYNVIGGNGGNGIRINNSNGCTVQANFIGMAADNTGVVPNALDGLLVSGTSKKTLIGGLIPLGNVISGNQLNGTEVADTASECLSFNTFGGAPAFKNYPTPNGLDGILITATGPGNSIKTCLYSGNLGNGVEIGGDASGVTVIDSTIGTNISTQVGIPNQMNGIAISGTAHGNIIGAVPKQQDPVISSGNNGYGIAILDSAYNNTIQHSRIGTGPNSLVLPNQLGGIYVDQGTSGTIIGGTVPPGSNTNYLQNVIENNLGNGISIISSKTNEVLSNLIEANTTGIYATGRCAGTSISGNTITGNTDTDVDISSAKGITYTP